MTEGFIFLRPSASGALFWSGNEPTFGDTLWKIKPKEWTTILSYRVFEPEKELWLRKAWYCSKCGLITFVHNPQRELEPIPDEKV